MLRKTCRSASLFFSVWVCNESNTKWSIFLQRYQVVVAFANFSSGFYIILSTCQSSLYIKGIRYQIRHQTPLCFLHRVACMCFNSLTTMQLAVYAFCGLHSLNVLLLPGYMVSTKFCVSFLKSLLWAYLEVAETKF